MNKPYTVHELVQKLHSFFQRPNVKLVILFGSGVSGKVHPESDLDFGVLADESLDTVEITIELIKLFAP